MTQVYYASYPSMKPNKVNWWVVYKIKPRRVIDAPTITLAFEEDEIEEHSIDNVDIVLGPLSYSNGGSMDIDDRQNSS